jgi:isopenicillin N synthase-like dioxygenase
MIVQIFDKCVHDLEINGGYALLPLSELQPSSNNAICNAFGTARCAFDEIRCRGDGSDVSLMPLIDPSTDSGGWTGYHKADVINGRYNQHREGFVFSNGEFFAVDSNVDFESDMKQFFHFCHDVVANGVLRAIERRLELPDCYFDKELGPTNNASQWHLKQYQVDELEEPVNDMSEQYDPKVLLPMHTDPSLISVVIIDSPGVNEGGKGLEVFHSNCSEGTEPIGCKTKSSIGTWKSIPHHGRDVAIIFVGSVLSYLTKRQVFSAIKHRVVDDCDGSINRRRMAATLFVRPHPDAYMKTLPSKYIQHESISSKSKLPTFRVWNARVAKNYMKKKKKQTDDST